MQVKAKKENKKKNLRTLEKLIVFFQILKNDLVMIVVMT